MQSNECEALLRPQSRPVVLVKGRPTYALCFSRLETPLIGADDGRTVNVIEVDACVTFMHDFFLDLVPMPGPRVHFYAFIDGWLHTASPEHTHIDDRVIADGIFGIIAPWSKREPKRDPGLDWY